MTTPQFRLSSFRSPPFRVVLFLLGYLVVLVGASLLKGLAPPAYADLLWGSLSSALLVALTWLFLSREQRAFSDVGMRADRHTPRRLAISFAGGFVVYPAALLAISVVLGPLQLSAPTWPTVSRWVLAVASYLALSVMEEVGFRGYALRTLVPAVGPWRAQGLIAVAFGLTHILYGYSWSTMILGVLPSALFFGALALRSGGLAAPIGAHAAVNLARWVVGEKDTPGVWTVSADPAHTARLTTGAPLIATAVMLAAAAAVWWWPARSPRA